MERGAIILESGRRRGAREIAVCAAAGAAAVYVVRRLRVALIVTGDEVRTAGDSRTAAQIWDVNTPMLVAVMDSMRVKNVATVQAPTTARASPRNWTN